MERKSFEEQAIICIPKDSTYEDGKGLSLILINSEKGKYLFECAKLKAESITLQDCIQPQLEQPSTLHSAHLRFVRDYETKGFLYVAKKYGNLGWRYKMVYVIRALTDLLRKIVQR